MQICQTAGQAALFLKMKGFHTACALLNELNENRQIEVILVWLTDIEASVLFLILLHYFAERVFIISDDMLLTKILRELL